MIDLSKVQNYYVACGYTDLRRGIDGLAAIVSQQYGGYLSEESLFLFCGRRTDRIKALYLNAQRARFGQSSEKKTYVLGEDQICLFNEAEQVQDHKAEEPTEETFTVKAHARKKKRTIDELAKNWFAGN